MRLLKITLFGVMQCLRGLRYTIFPHTAHYFCSFLKRVVTKLIVLRSEVCSDWPAIWHIVIGRIPQGCDGNVTLTKRIVMSISRLKQ